jgi:Leucine-rich repeat (LRR) protein
LSSLPESFGNLKSLQISELKSNQLINLPESFGNLKELWNLKLASNQLISLPESFGNCVKLQDLDLKNNQLTSLPESLGNLPRLMHVNLDNNQLTCLPQSIGKIRFLTNLTLENNLLSILPDSFRNLKALEWLLLSKNPLNSLSNLSIKNLKIACINIGYLTPKGRKLCKEERYEELFEYYHKTPQILTLEYVSNPVSLADDERERLIHEASKTEIKILENIMPINDPILIKIIKRNSRGLSSGFKIYL